MKKLILFLFLILAINLEIPSTAWSADPVWLPNIPGYATGTAGSGASAGHNGIDVNITSPISVTQPADGPTGSPVPADANYLGGNKAGNLVGLLVGQQTMANSLACVLPSDQSAIPVTGTFWQATQPVSAASLPLPTGAATSANQTNGSQQTQVVNGANVLGVNASGQIAISNFPATQSVSQSGAPWSQNITQFGGNAVVTGTGASGLGIPRVTVSSDSSVVLGAGSAIVGKVGIDQTTPGTTNGVQVNAALPAGANVIGKVSIDQTTPGTTNRVQSNLDQVGGSAISLGQKTMANSVPVTMASDQVAPKTYGNAGAAFSQTSVTTTASTISAPANAVRVIIQGDSGNTDCIRWRFDGTAATATVGMVAQPGQDSGQMDSGASVSVAACSGTQKVNVQYFAQ